MWAGTHQQGIPIATVNEAEARSESCGPPRWIQYPVNIRLPPR
jgi:hypothetical protein